MFRFVVRRLRWLARVPFFPQFFDTALLVWTALRHRPRLAAMEELEAHARQMPGMRLRVHRLGGIEFHLSGRELGHVHGNGLLDVRVGREVRDELLAAHRVEPHHVAPKSGWVSFWLRSPADVAQALDLLTLAANNTKRANFPLGNSAAAVAASLPSLKPEEAK